MAMQCLGKRVSIVFPYSKKNSLKMASNTENVGI